jgi:Fe-S oxidoreductase
MAPGEGPGGKPVKDLPAGPVQHGIRILQDPVNSRLLTHLNSCVHCGLCAESCLFYRATGDERFTPARKVDLVASVYRRYCTAAGKIMPWLTGARLLDEKTTGEMADLLFGACTMCGRCTLHCSIGVDIPLIVHAGRKMLSEMGLVPPSLQATVTTALETGNNMGISTADFKDTLQWMEEELIDEVQSPEARIPLDEHGKRVLYTLNPREPKFFPLSISAMAKIFYAAGESWTLSTKMYDITNYGYFSGSTEDAANISARLWAEAEQLGSSEVVLAECGHGTRVMRWEAPNYFERKAPFRVITSVECIAAYLREGKIRLDPEKINKSVTLHDPCNLVRSGGIVNEQRFILKSFLPGFREMIPHGIDNFCCGGGGGQLAMSEYNERRMKAGEIKAEQIRNSGAEIVVSPCHNCVDQLIQVNSRYNLGVQIKTLAEIVADALIL